MERPDAYAIEVSPQLIEQDLHPQVRGTYTAHPQAHDRWYGVKLARLGGCLGRTRDGPPGNVVVWRGLARLTDIDLGFLLSTEVVGN